MYPIFCCAWFLLLFKLVFNVDIASDKESLKKSLGQVSLFLDNVGQSIQKEKKYLEAVNAAKSNAPSNTATADYDKMLISKKTSTATLKSNIVDDLIAQEKLAKIEDDNRRNKNYMKAPTKIDKDKKNDGPNHDSDVDIFGDMIFPPKSDIPGHTPQKIDRPIPDVLKPDFIPDKVVGGPSADMMSTKSTTDFNDLLLDPKEFGFTSTRRPIPTYGDYTGSAYIPSEHLTTKVNTAFATVFKNDMAKLGLGVFSACLLKMFHWVIYKKPEDVQRITWGFARLVEHYHTQEKLDSFGEPTRHAFLHSTRKAAEMRSDERRTQAIMLHNALEHRWDMLSQEVNSILEHIDSLYLKDETEDLINSMESIEQFSNVSAVPYTYLDAFLSSVLAPWQRLKDTFRGETLRENLNRAIKKRFYSDQDAWKLQHGPSKLRTEKKDEIISRKHNNGFDFEKYEPSKYIDRKIDKAHIEPRNDKSIKIIHWIPNFTYRAGKKIEKKVTEAKVDVDEDTIEKEYQGFMSAITEASRAVTTRPRTKSKIKNKKNKEAEKRSDRSQSSEPDVKVKAPVPEVKIPKKRHKKRHRHRHKHAISTHGLAKLLKIIKYLRPHHKREKHRKRHHRYGSKFWTRFRAVSSHQTNEDSKMKLEDLSDHSYSEYDGLKDIKKKPTYVIPTNQFYSFVTLPHDKRNLAFRRRMSTDKKIGNGKSKAMKLREDSVGSDEEIQLKMNLLKAMGGEDFKNFFKVNKKGLLDKSDCSTDEEAYLKSKIYKYFKEA
ncbi:uncharacterized protein LOC128682313 [Plodia interpunctella]|uniref:uncharacterized protein LOC128682313 n=1 Tax=Plodia interpunctella TaxID=58824 RepID=UPI002367F99C|nr:uncharacterized protein LOC128682313 [Plodia interpunctella]